MDQPWVDVATGMATSRSHYPEKESALYFKDAVAQRFGHSDVVFYLLKETHFLHLIALLSKFSNFLVFLVS